MLHIHLTTIDSTNNFLRNFHPEKEEDITLVTADFQTAGRGQRGNSWESEEGKNVVYSLLVHPRHTKPSRIFFVSEVAALSICEALAPLSPSSTFPLMGRNDIGDDQSDECNQSLPLMGDFCRGTKCTARSDGEGLPSFCIKWPNDIYYGDRKIAGILIETDLMGGRIENAIIGVGVNINQREFRSDAPNPVSLFQLTGHETDCQQVLRRIMERFTALYALLEQGEYDTLHARFKQRLYCREGLHPYTDENGQFDARILDIEPTGHLLLEDSEGLCRRYAFKEVSFVIPL